MPALYGAGTGFWCGIVATIASATADGTNALVPSVLTVAALSSLTTVLGAFATALQTWLLYASFVIGHTGQVALTDASVNAALVLGGTAVGATVVGAGIRWIQMPVVVARTTVVRVRLG
ncbi:hypothetical protein LWC34_09710 [Kibdelosporangium philippinense]|uniref:DUF1097 domain-containing protein n=2 Tax=Kibdelosporangium philippinense TaxID=211113 RepID=A0ABS8ZB99_9PSEU|nr:hypothetical protein [Kibdelosporangium philippinense]MCE7003102.1 hypothetical protein [Kibdelosporangium philippinense]